MLSRRCGSFLLIICRCVTFGLTAFFAFAGTSVFSEKLHKLYFVYLVCISDVSAAAVKAKIGLLGNGAFAVGTNSVHVIQSFKFYIRKKILIEYIEFGLLSRDADFMKGLPYFPRNIATERGASKKETQSARRAAARVKRVFFTPTAP